MRVGIGIPSISGIDLDVFISLLNNIISLSSKHEVVVITDKNIPLDYSRTLIVNKALENNIDVLVFIDSDIVLCDKDFNKINNALSLLVENVKEYKIVTGLYWLKRGVLNIYDFEIVDNFPLLTFYTDKIPDYVDGSGLGIVAIDINVFKEIEKPWFRFVLDNKDRIIGEDVYFFTKLKEKGIRVRVEKNVWGLHRAGGWFTKDNVLIIDR
jgi:hypothetical protein